MVTPCITRVRKSHSSTAPSSAGTKLKPGAGDRVQIAGDEAPQHDVDRHPGEHRQHARRAAAQQVELAQHDGGDAAIAVHDGAAPRCSGLARHGDEQVLEARLAVLARQRLRGRPPAGSCRATGTARGRRPPRPRTCCGRSTARRSGRLGGEPRMPARMSRAAGGVERGGGLVEQQQARAVQHRLGERQPGSARRRTARPHLVSRKRSQVELSEQLLDALREVLDAVDQAEDAQVLLHRQVAGQRRIDGGEVGARERPASAASRGRRPRSRCRPRSGSSTPRIMLMVVVLPAPFGPEQPDDLARRHLEADTVDRLQRAVGLGEPFDGEDRGARAHEPS